MTNKGTTVTASKKIQIPPLRISEKKNEIMGFRLGGTFSSQESAFLELKSQGYESPPKWGGKSFQRFMIEKEIASDDGFEVAFTFEYENEQLKRMGVIITRERQEEEIPLDVLRDIEGSLIDALGAPHLILDRTEEWVKNDIDTQDPSLAYALFWSNSKTVEPHRTVANESARFFDAVGALGHDGALATISGVLGSVIASVDFFQGQQSTVAASQFLSFMKK